MASSELIYAGDILCMDRSTRNAKHTKPCTQKAYYQVQDPIIISKIYIPLNPPNPSDMSNLPATRYVCGLHVHHYRKSERLPDNPQKNRERKKKRQKNQEKVQQYKELLLQQAQKNQMEQKCGKVRYFDWAQYVASPTFDTIDQLLESQPGVLWIFLNIKRSHRPNSWGCNTLLPKFLGPVIHAQPNLPPAQRFENFWQFSHIYAEEFDTEKQTPLPIFFERQMKAFLSTTLCKPKIEDKQNNEKKPLYFVWRNSDGSLRLCNPAQARRVYCFYYAQLVEEKDDFKKIQAFVKNGVDIQICGNSEGGGVGENRNHDENLQKINERYFQNEFFSYELILYTLLTVPNRQNHPWNKSK